MEIRKRKTRMYEPWGYVDENNYQGASIILDNDLESFFAEVSYNKDDNKIHFANKDGEEKATLDVNEFVKSDSIVEKAWYEDGKIYVKFTNGDVITVDVEELIDQNEFADGLQVNEGIVSVLIDSNSETFLSVSESGVKVSGVQDAINAERDRAISAETALDEKIDKEINDRIADVDEEESRAISAETALDEKIEAEITRAETAEQALDEKIDTEIARATSAETALDEKIDAEIARATAEEQRIDAKLDQEIADRKEDVDTEEVRAKAAEAALDVRIDTLNDALTNEKARAEAAEQELSTRLTTEIADRKADVDEEEARAKAAEEALDAKIDQEIADRINAVENEEEAREAADNRLQEAITSEVSRATNAETLLNQKIDQEIADREADVLAEENRAISAETALDEKIDAETARAISAETALQENITAEETARINRDTELTGLIEAEVVTARREETRIETKLDQEIADRKAEAIASAEYVKNDVKIYFKNDNGETLSTIDASDFIADGMIEDVQLVESGNTSVLVITWNTDGGSKVTRLDVGDIFEADNYYTKVQIDAIEEGLQDEIDAEEIRAEAAESALTEAIAAEATRAQGAEGDLQDAIDAEEARAISAETGLNNAIAAEATRAKAAEQANANAIAAEQSRAEGVESALTDSIADEEARAKAAEAKKVDRQVNGTNGKALIFNETDGGGAKFENTDGINSFVGVNDAGAGGIDAQIYAINKDTKEGSRLDVSNTGVYYTVGSDAPASRMVADNEIATKGNVNEAVSSKADAADVYTKAEVNDALDLKADKTEIPTDFYTKEEVDAMMSQLLTRIENLEKKESIVVADTAEDVENAPANSDIVLASTEAIQALTAGTEYNTITIVGGNANNGDIKAKATEKLTVDGVTINGDKGASNGRVLISASTVDLKNVTIETGSTAYNVFEGTQNTADSAFFTSTYNVSNLTADNTALNHNVVNIYTPANDAVINIKDCNLNLDVDKSNMLRMANYTNATGVTINFENVEWTYENAPASDWSWAGLMIFQPSGNDAALSGDTSKIATWTVNVKNCKYNGEKVTSNNFGEHNQVVYLYDINRTGAVTDADSVMTINFE